MITEYKINKIFCIAYDFFKGFDAQMEKYTFKAKKRVQLSPWKQRFWLEASTLSNRGEMRQHLPTD